MAEEREHRVEEPQAILKAIGADLSRLPPELHAQYERVVGKALSRAAREDEAASHFARAERIYRALGNAPGLLELSNTRADLDGSRARDDARPDSDYDVAVFLRDMPDRIAELYRLADLSTAILENGGDFIHAMPYPAGFYNDERMPLMFAIRAEGIDL